MIARMLLPLAGLLASAALAETPPCEVASGLGTRACTFPEGQVVVESDLVDRIVDHAGGLHTDTLYVGDTIVHVGVRRGLEAQIGWTAYDREHTRFVRTGAELRSSGVGDVTLGAKLALLDARDHALGLSLQPTLSIPTGDLELGARGLGGGVLLALSYDLGDALTLELTPEANVTGDRADDDRHWEYGATLGLAADLGRRLSATAELRRFREEDPAFRRTKTMAALSFGWMPWRLVQFNVGGAKGLDRRSPKLQLLAGVALHFL